LPACPSQFAVGAPPPAFAKVGSTGYPEPPRIADIELGELVMSAD